MNERFLRRWTHVMSTGDRGDVPGWVLVAVMTAGLVTTLWVAADDQLSNVCLLYTSIPGLCRRSQGVR